MKVLITSGATREPIDGVRFITNFSTGATGAVLADAFRRRGHEIVYLHGLGAQRPRDHRPCVCFSSFQDLDHKLKALLRQRRFDVILHVAAVGDYSVAAVTVAGRRRHPSRLAKLDSSSAIRLELKPNFKLLDRLPVYAGNRPLIVGFKLTNTRDSAAVLRAVGKLRSELVVHNDLHDMTDNRTRKFSIFASGVLLAECSSRADVARKLCAIAEERTGHAARARRRQ